MNETKSKATPKKSTTKPATTKKIPAAKKAASTPASVPGPVLVPTPSHEQIARRAYEIWAGRGYTHGDQAHDWWQAETELKRA